MFGPKDLCTVREVWDSLFGFSFGSHGYTSSTPAFKFDGQSLFEDTCDLCWTFLSGAKTATIAMPNGKHEPAKSQLFGCTDTDQDVGVHLSLKLGTVGSGNPFFRYGLNADLDAVYGASRRCMVYVNMRELEAFLSELKKSEKNQSRTQSPFLSALLNFTQKIRWQKGQRLRRLSLAVSAVESLIGSGE